MSYRYIQDVMFSCDESMVSAYVGLRRGDNWVMQFPLARYGIMRWVAAPDKGVISTTSSPVTIACDPPVDGVVAHVIYDTEPDRSLHPASWRDYRLEWGDWWDDPDNEIPWWRKKPQLVAYRRRVKPAKMWVENIEWLGGQTKVWSGALCP